MALTGLAVLGVWVVVLTLGLNLAVEARLRSQADDVLRARAEAAAATVEPGPTGLRIHDTAGDSAIDVGTWIFEGTTPVERPRAGTRREAQAARLAGRGQRLDQTGGTRGVRWYAQPVRRGGRQVGTVVTSLSLAPYRSIEEVTVLGTAVLGILLLGAAWLTLWAGVARALRPVAEMTHQAARWSAHEVDRRFRPAGRPPELEDLAITLDGVLDRLSAVLRHEKQLSAEISHELRTPMSRVLAEIDLLRASPGPDVATQHAALDTIESSTHEMHDILETLMTAARSEGAPPGGRCDAVAVANSLVQALTQPDLDVHVVAHESVTAGVDGDVLARALSPLLDNAVRYARSTVEVRVTAGEAVQVEVRDDGPGIPEDDLPRLFEPGWRAGGADRHQGAGLGLALARRLVTAAGGSMRATDTGHGAQLTVTVPSA